jgi:hypothetical protein
MHVLVVDVVEVVVNPKRRNRREMVWEKAST